MSTASDLDLLEADLADASADDPPATSAHELTRLTQPAQPTRRRGRYALTPEREQLLRTHYDRSVCGNGRRLAALLDVPEHVISSWALQLGLRGLRGSGGTHTAPPAPPAPPRSTPRPSRHQATSAATGATDSSALNRHSTPSTPGMCDMRGRRQQLDQPGAGVGPRTVAGTHPRAVSSHLHPFLHHAPEADMADLADLANRVDATGTATKHENGVNRDDDGAGERAAVAALIGVYGGDAPPPPLPPTVVERLNALVASTVVTAAEFAATRMTEAHIATLQRELDHVRQENERLRRCLTQVAALVGGIVGDMALDRPPQAASSRA